MRLAVRAVIVKENRLLLVNAWPGVDNDLWCAPGGGAEKHASLKDNLMREVHEETGLTVHVGAPCLVNEYHSEGRDFHQVEVFFRCSVTAGETSETWRDPEGVVNRFCWVTESEARGLRLKPSSLPDVAFRRVSLLYDPLEPLAE